VVERRFYCPELSIGIVSLPPEEVHHGLTVLRIHKGDVVTLFNGTGTEADGSVIEVSRKSAQVRVEALRMREFEFSTRLTLAVAMIRGHRQDYMIEKCTELGVFAFQPLTTHRGIVKSTGGAVDKWRRRAIEAAKQSKRAWVPMIHEPASLHEALSRVHDFEFAAVGDPGPTATPLSSALAAKNTDPAIVFIGPEGGWTNEERAMFAASSIQCVGLSPTVLRTETAAIAASAIVAIRSVDPSERADTLIIAAGKAKP